MNIGNLLVDLPEIELMCLNSILGILSEGEPNKEWVLKTVNQTIMDAVRLANGESGTHNKNSVAARWCEQNREIFKKIDIENITILDYAKIRLLYGNFNHRVLKIANILDQ
jgi:hypothetical protein